MKDAATDAIRSDLGHFLERYSEEYLVKWKGLISGKTRYAGFNWAAFLFGSLWCVYRRLYAIALLVFIAEFVVGASAFLFVVTRIPYPVLSLDLFVTIAVLVVVRPVLGLMANSLLYRKALRVIERAPTDSSLERAQYMEKAGKTNGVLTGILATALFLINLATRAIPMLS